MVATAERRVQIIFEILVKNAEKNMRKLSNAVASNIQKWKQNAELLDRNTRKYVNTAARLDDIVKRSQVMGRWTESYQKEMGKTTEVVTQRMIRLNNLTKRQIEFLKKQGFEVKDVTAAIGKKGQLLKRNYAATIAYDTSVKRLTRAHERFKMHLLSVMFFGMQLQRTFGGLVTNALKMTGILDVLSAALNLVVFTVLEPFIPIIYDILEWFINLPKDTKRMVGAFIMAIAIIGSFLAIIGMLGLAFQGLKEFITDALPLDLLLGWIPGLGEFAKSLEGTLTTWHLIAIVLGSIGALTTGIYASSKALDENLNSLLSGLMNFFNYLTITDAAAEEIHQEGEESVSTLNVLNKLSEVLGNIWKGIQEEGFFETITNYLKKIIDYLNKIGKISDEQAENMKTKIDEVKEKLNLKKLDEDIDNIFTDISEGNLPKLLNDIGVFMWDIHESAKTLITDYIVPTIYWQMVFLFDDIKREAKRVIDDIGEHIENMDWYKKLSPLIDIIEWVGDKIDDFGRELRGLGRIPLPGFMPGFITSPLGFFQAGGVVPGPIGRPVPAIVHGGETVLPHGVSPVNISINVESPTLSSRLDMSDLADEISLSLTRELRRLGFI